MLFIVILGTVLGLVLELLALWWARREWLKQPVVGGGESGERVTAVTSSDGTTMRSPTSRSPSPSRQRRLLTGGAGADG